MHPFVAEFLSTMLLILFGNGVVANVNLAKTNGFAGGWIVVTAGWGLAVFIGVFCAGDFSEAHLNPAVSVAMLIAGKLTPAFAAGYIVAQTLGAMMGALLVFLFYREHFRITQDPDAKMACFCTGPSIRNLPQAFFLRSGGNVRLDLTDLLNGYPQFDSERNASRYRSDTWTRFFGSVTRGTISFWDRTFSRWDHWLRDQPCP